VKLCPRSHRRSLCSDICDFIR